MLIERIKLQGLLSFGPDALEIELGPLNGTLPRQFVKAGASANGFGKAGAARTSQSSM